MNKTIRHTFKYPQSVETVWSYLTESELLAQWLMPNNIKAEIGHQFQFKAKPMPRFGFDGIVHCEILEMVTNERLVYSWKGGSLNTIVTWTLVPVEDGTILTLEQSGFNSIKNLLPYFIMNGGWKKICTRLLKTLHKN